MTFPPTGWDEELELELELERCIILAVARAAETETVAIRLWPHAWPMSGRASFFMMVLSVDVLIFRVV